LNVYDLFVMLMHPSWVISIFQTLIGQIYNLLTIIIAASTCFSMFLKQYCFDELVSEHTQLQSSGKDSLLDLVLCNDPFIVCDGAICDPFRVSDHCSIKLNVITPAQSAGLPAHDFRDFNTADWSCITSNLKSCDWLTVFKDCVIASQFADAVYAELNNVVNMFVP